MAWWFDVIERKHQLQNPTSPQKILALGTALGLTPDSRVLDMAAGKGGPALLLCDRFGCHITCVEKATEFVVAARERVAAAGLESRITVVEQDASAFEFENGGYDAVLCLGASFIWGGLSATVEALAPAVTARGGVVVGEPYWRRWPLPDGFEPGDDFDYVTLVDTVARFETPGLELITVIASSEDDWDRYESLHWDALEEWLDENPSHPDAEEFRALGREERDFYLRWQRDLLGWALFVGRKR